MAWLSEAHSEWHAVHGPVVCPLDCGIGEGQDDYDHEPLSAEEEAELEAWRGHQREMDSSDYWDFPNAPF